MQGTCISIHVHTHIDTYIHANMQTDRQTDRPPDRQTDSQTDRQTDRHTLHIYLILEYMYKDADTHMNKQNQVYHHGYEYDDDDHHHHHHHQRHHPEDLRASRTESQGFPKGKPCYRGQWGKA